MKKKTQLKTRISACAYFLMVALFFSFSSSQAQNQVKFQGEVIELPNNMASFNLNAMPENSKFNGGYFGWARFSETPTQDIQDQFASRNLELIEYFPDKTYLFYFPESTQTSFLQASGIVSIIPIENNFKKASQIKLNTIDSYAMQGNKVLLMLEHYNFISSNLVINKLLKNGTVEIIEDYKGSSMIQIAVPYNQIDAVVSKPFVKWVELIPAPAVKEDVQGRNLHRASNLDTQTATGRNYTGLGVGVMVRDDGVVGPHIDFQGRIDNSATTTIGQTHGDGVAGILAGAGNLDPRKRGMAAGTNIFVTLYASTMLDPETTSLINNGTIQITNSSYGDGCNGGYTLNSRTVDTQTNTTSSLLHVFSAGNSGTSNCGYGAGSGWGNITGGHKQGKNVIATANTFFNGELATSSSHGPAADGRIKPDITAHGANQQSTNENNTYQSFGGTSGASPGIAGVSAQLYEAYAGLNGGTFPESALIKATLLNTANDYGNVGPDFSFGWGLVNGLRAAMLIEEGRYLNSTVTQGTNNNHSITVPLNTSQVRFMVYWSDEAAAPGASPALVNDLDLVVTDPGSTVHQPWILDSTPNAANLDTPATTGADHLNNMEQVLINNPTSGIYNINISGFNVPIGPQKYYVVYEIITDGLTLTYPLGGEKFEAGTQEIIHWDSVNAVNSHVLEYSTDNGTNWNAMATLPALTTNYTWTIPNGLAFGVGDCLVRITNGVLTDQSTSKFSISSRVTGVNISQVCPSEVTVNWNAVTNATSYDVYLLGNKFMEVVGNSTTTSLAIPITDPFTPIWVAVSAKGGNGWESLRTNAVNYTGSGLFNCPLNNDLSVTTIGNTANDFETICSTDPIIISVNIQNGGTIPQSNFMVSYQIGTGTVVSQMYSGTLAAGASNTFSFTTPVTLTANEASSIKVWTSLPGDEFTSNDEKTLSFYAQVTGTALDFAEPFDVNGVLPSGWVINNPDNAITWQERTNVVGIDGNATTTAFVDGANYTTRGQEDTMTTEYFDLNYNGTAELKFDLAKAQWSAAYNDGLRVEVSIDCGVTFTQVYFKDGLNLATVPYTNSAWTPNSIANWRTEIIDLTPYVGETILLRFININDYSNGTFIDNINLTKVVITLSVDENILENAISVYPNPSKDHVNISINTTIGDTYQMELLNSLGQRVTTVSKTRFNTKAEHKLDVSSYGSGLYFLKVKINNTEVIKKIIIE
ncbi:S8 family serine peptidase [Lacinutrix jangbogonensis]|uniref:S8 family serine peptidase n=1 Tax=Lacinutrix jangbogonensis TaxID=1469557 RepID=UPI00053DCDE1|nr:S8 family serine peptidase [Lacinutrix jangbogonensis]